MGSMIGKISEELPRHEVLAKTAAYEIRKYAPCVVAETNYVSKGMMDQGGSSPFMQLAKFIGVMATPENEGAAPIAMTAPVLMSHAPAAPPGTGDGDVAYKMAFFLPASRFSTAADVPAPTSPQVSIADVPARARTYRRRRPIQRHHEGGVHRRERGAAAGGVEGGWGADGGGSGGDGGGVQSPVDAAVVEDERSHARGDRLLSEGVVGFFVCSYVFDGRGRLTTRRGKRRRRKASYSHSLRERTATKRCLKRTARG